MAVEFTVWAVPKGTKTEDMPFFCMDKAEIIFDERHPSLEFHELINNVRDLTSCTDDYVRVPEEHYHLIEPFIEKVDHTRDFVLSCL